METMNTLQKTPFVDNTPAIDLKKITVKKSSEKYAASYTQTFDLVAREGKFLSISSGYSLDEMVRFIRTCRDCGYPQFLLINENDNAVGWCDIVRRSDQPDDVGYLGIGILKEYRHKGLGMKLMTTAINEAKKRGFHEIRLEVRASNVNAIRTYRRLGFVKIAHLKDGVITDGVAEDVWLMSLLSRELNHEHFDGEDFLSRFPKIKYKFKRKEGDGV